MRGPGKGGMKDRRGGSHQSGVWWLEIRDHIARGDCSLPNGYEHECVCVGRGAELLGVSLWGLHSSSVMYFMAPSAQIEPSLSTLSTVACCTEEGSHTEACTEVTHTHTHVDNMCVGTSTPSHVQTKHSGCGFRLFQLCEAAVNKAEGQLAAPRLSACIHCSSDLNLEQVTGPEVRRFKLIQKHVLWKISV